MAQLQSALTNVNAAVNETKKITDSAFSDLSNSQSTSQQSETSSYTSSSSDAE